MRKNSKKNHSLHLHSTINVAAIKVYLEQCLKPDGSNYTEDEIKNLTKEEVAQKMKEHLATIISHFPKEEAYIIAMIHDKDLVATKGSPFLPSAEKPHAHILFKFRDRLKRIHLSTLLNKMGLRFRNPEDIALFNNGGCETIGSFNSYTLYLTHDTEQAIKDGKYQYSIDDYISNLTKEEIQQIRDKKSKMLEPSGKVTMELLTALDKEAYELGYKENSSDEDYQRFYESLPFYIRSHHKMKYIKESFYAGQRRGEAENKKIREIHREIAREKAKEKADKWHEEYLALSDKEQEEYLALSDKEQEEYLALSDKKKKVEYLALSKKKREDYIASLKKDET